MDQTSDLLAKSPDLDLIVSYGTNISRGAKFALKTAFPSGGKKICLLPVTDEDVIGDFPHIQIPIRKMGETAAEILIRAMDGNLDSQDRHCLLKAYTMKYCASSNG